jgi:hypothetical protein
MTRDEILKMEAGRELDELIAEKIMGLKPCTFRMTGQISMSTIWNCEHNDCRNCYPKNQDAPMKSYSTDISSAWEVVNNMSNCLHLKQHGQDGVWVAEFCHNPGSQVSGKTAPLAICRAALLAVSEEK